VFCKFRIIFYNSEVDLVKFINIPLDGSLALIGWMPIFYWQEGKQENGLLIQPKPFAPETETSSV
jgi:hypothetical protein